MIEFPNFVYCSPGLHSAGGTKTYTERHVNNTEELNSLLSSGWFLTLPEALSSKKEEKKEPEHEESFDEDEFLAGIDEKQAEEPTDEPKHNADVDGDGKVTREDALIMAQDLGIEVPRGAHTNTIMKLVNEKLGT